MSVYWHDEPLPPRRQYNDTNALRALFDGPSLEEIQPLIDQPHSALAERCYRAERDVRCLSDRLDEYGIALTRARMRETELETELEKDKPASAWAPWWCWAMSGAGVTLAYEEAGWTWALGAIAVLALSWWTITTAVKESEL